MRNYKISDYKKLEQAYKRLDMKLYKKIIKEFFV